MTQLIALTQMIKNGEVRRFLLDAARIDYCFENSRIESDNRTAIVLRGRVDPIFVAETIERVEKQLVTAGRKVRTKR